MTFVGWGSGTVTEDKDVVYSGSESLRITTQGQFQGASITLAQPADLGPYIANKNAYLEIAILSPLAGNQRGGALAGFQGRFGSRGPAGMRNGYSNPNRSIRAASYSRTAQQYGSRGFQPPKRLANLRVLLVGTDGTASEVLLPLDSATMDHDWRLLHIPIPAITGLTADSARIKEMRLFGDVPAVLHLGLVRVVTDATPLTIIPLGEQIVPRQARFRYTATASAGIMPLAYSWDFDESDGIQDEAHGRSAAHSYLKSGDYTATVTVSDLYGFHPPQAMKFKIHVTP
jgi:hypothetical protein